MSQRAAVDTVTVISTAHEGMSAMTASTRRIIVLLLAGATALTAAAGSPATASSGTSASASAGSTPAGSTPVDGSHGGGDPYFPEAGNGGYDVQHYDVDIRYTPADRRFAATAAVRLRTTLALRSFSLDLRGLTASRVSIDGRAARFTQAGRELVITPATPLARGRTATVTVVYGGTAGTPTDIEDAPYGWYSFADGAMVVSEPDGSSTWFPVNDIAADKATLDVSVTVPSGPSGTVAVGNGRQARPARTVGGWTTWSWSARDPLSPYLATASVGNFRITTTRGPHNLPIINAVDADLTAANLATTTASLALQPQMITFFEGIFGRYPFEAFGAIVDDDSVGYALETQTRPVYSRVARENTVAHELAHQWVGDSVGPAAWQHIWLNEGFASYAQWLWSEHRGQKTADAAFAEVMAIPADDEFWTTVIADPGPLHLFVDPVYDRGAATLHALRRTIGDAAFFTLLRRWTTQNAGGSVTTADLVTLAEQVSGRDLTAFFRTWVYSAGKPAVPS